MKRMVPNYVNHLEMKPAHLCEPEQEINGREPGEISRAPKFHTIGVKNKKLRLDWYREKEVCRKLHLKDQHRSTLSRVAGNCFKKSLNHPNEKNIYIILCIAFQLSIRVLPP